MPRMRRLPVRSALRSCLALALVLGVPSAGVALSIQLQPTDQTVDVGEIVAVDVVVRSPGGVLIGGYDLLVSFDAALLGFRSVDFGSGLGGPADSIQDFVVGASDVEIVEVSLLGMPPQDGASDFVLFTLRFAALLPGTSALDMMAGSDPATDFLADDGGLAIVPTAIVPGRVIVAVLEPGLSCLLALGALGFIRHSRPTRGASR